MPVLSFPVLPYLYGKYCTVIKAGVHGFASGFHIGSDHVPATSSQPVESLHCHDPARNIRTRSGELLLAAIAAQLRSIDLPLPGADRKKQTQDAAS